MTMETSIFLSIDIHDLGILHILTSWNLQLPEVEIFTASSNKDRYQN